MKNNIKVCFFGTYKHNYSRNSSLRNGLQLAQVKVVEVQSEIPDEKMELPQDFTLRKTIWRIGRKIRAYIYLLSRAREVISADYIFVLHPGHLDLPFAWILSKIAGAPLIFDTSISPYDTMFIGRAIASKNSFKAKLVKFTEKSLLKLPIKVFVDTELMKKFVAAEIGVNEQKIFIVPLGANDLIYKPGTEKTPQKTTQVFFFGLYNPMHGTQYIMQAIKLLKSEQDIKFTLLGDGYLKAGLIRFAKRNKLTNVTFLDFVPEPELVKNIQNVDIILGAFSNSPIFQRQIPNKVFAALACRKPLICARYPALEEILVHKKHVYFCKPEDPQSLATAIKELAKDKALQSEISKNGYQIYKQKFTPIKIGETLLKGIES